MNKSTEIQNQLNELIDNLAKNSPGSDEYTNTSKKISKLTTLLNLTLEAEKTERQLHDARLLLENEEFKAIANEEVKVLEERLDSLNKKLSSLMQKALPDDDKKAIFEIRPGVGGVEASLFAEDLYRMYVRYLNSINYKISVYSTSYETEGGIKEVVFLVDKEGSFGEFRFEAGVHRVQRVPVTESAGRIHTSTATVVVLPEQKENDVEIKQEDLRIDVYRSSGPGGQSVNTTDSAVRVLHKPTGIIVTCQEGKSQHRNKEIALSILRSRLYEIEQNKKAEQDMEIRELAIQGGERSAKIRTYNFPQGRITDHRINKSWFNITEVVNGSIGEIINEVSKTLRSELESKDSKTQ